MYESERALRRFSAGLPSLDQALGGGFCAGGVYVLAGRKNVGTDALATQIASAAAQFAPVLFLTMVMPPSALWNRVLASQSGVAFATIMDDALSQDEHTLYCDASSQMSERRLHILSPGSIYAEDVEGSLRRIQGVRLLVLDYLALMRCGPGFNESVPLTESVSWLADLAVRKQLAVLATLPVPSPQPELPTHALLGEPSCYDAVRGAGGTLLSVTGTTCGRQAGRRCISVRVDKGDSGLPGREMRFLWDPATFHIAQCTEDGSLREAE